MDKERKSESLNLFIIFFIFFFFFFLYFFFFIFIGAVWEDSSGYPDCKPEFFKAFEKVVEIGTKPSTQIKIVTPIINFTKKDIVLKGLDLNAPLQLTWSCYQEEEEACGVCDSCALRLRGFQQAGIEDPIKYKTKPIYKD